MSDDAATSTAGTTAGTTPGSTAAEEQAVREYLTWITDPSQLIDPALIATLEREASGATDPIVKLKALSRLEQARNVDGERFKLSFIKHAKAWADSNQITVAAFRELGVDDTILRAAGIGLSSAKSTSRSGGSTSSTSARGPRASGGSNVSTEQIKTEVLTWTEQFVLSDVVGRIGGSPMTVRKALDDLVDAGKVRKLGPDQDHHGRGRAPIVYRVI